LANPDERTDVPASFFEGTGTLPAFINATTIPYQVGGSNGNNATVKVGTRAAGKLVVTYNLSLTQGPNTPIPEPSANFGLLVLGGLGLLKFRKAKQS